MISSYRDPYGNINALFKVATARAGDVYMTLRDCSGDGEEHSIVFIDSDKFIELWRNEPYSLEHALSHGNETIWRNDYKFNRAQQGFSIGSKNPVPVANVVCYQTKSHHITYERKMLMFKKIKEVKEITFPYMAIDDGVTRTIWLLANGASRIPIQVPTSCIQWLSQYEKDGALSHMKLSEIYESIVGPVPKSFPRV